MLKVWISGANGHLGQALCTRLDREKYQLIATDVAEVDVTVPAEVRAFADLRANLKPWSCAMATKPVTAARVCRRLWRTSTPPSMMF